MHARLAIPTERKVAYIQSLLRVGFDSIDFGVLSRQKRFQMQDTAAVSQLDLSQTKVNWLLLPIPEEHK
jgi:hydroxymethylglutaryl-CoA lyase